ncbi:MAG: PorT family protein [Treponema sp.]|jgi:hypothetical protein|nr:PorT family protein [Treponema sp.]
MNKKSIKSWFAFFSLSLMVLFPGLLSAQSGAITGDYDGRAVVSIVPFIGEEEAAKTFYQAVVHAVNDLQKYRARELSAEDVSAAEVRIPTNMPPVRELTPGDRYSLTGGVYPGNNDNEYYIQLWLWDMSGSNMIYTDDLVYQNIDEGLETVPGLVEWLFSHIIEKQEEAEPVAEEIWEDKRMNMGFRSGVSQRWYTAPGEIAAGAHALVYEGGIFAAIFLNPLLSIQAEINVTLDNLVFRGLSRTSEEGYGTVLTNMKYSSNSLMFPLLFKGNFKYGNFRFAPFAGIYAFLPLGKTSYRIYPAGTTDSFSWSARLPLGVTAGLETAIKAGPGMILADIRYAGDFGTINIDDGEDTAYKRGMISFTLGYGFGFINLKK